MLEQEQYKNTNPRPLGIEGPRTSGAYGISTVSTTWMTPLDWKTLAMVTFDMPPLASVSQMAPFLEVAVRVSPWAVFSMALPPPALTLADRSMADRRPGTTW